MKKRLIALMIIAVIFVAAIPATASAAAYYSYYPVNYETWITYNSIGTPVFNIMAVNNTNEKIVAFEFRITPKDAYGNGLSAYDFGYTWSKDVRATDAEMDGKDSYSQYYYTLYGFDRATKNTECYLMNVTFADGTVWYNPGKVYEEADFEILNEKDSQGRYLIDDTHTVELYQTGCSVYARDWYIWNEGVGWVWFSDEMVPSFTLKTLFISKRLLINSSNPVHVIMVCKSVML